MGFLDVFKKKDANIKNASVAKMESEKRQNEITQRILNIIFHAHINPAIKAGEFECVYRQGFGDVMDEVIEKLRSMGFVVCYEIDEQGNENRHAIVINWEK